MTDGEAGTPLVDGVFDDPRPIGGQFTVAELVYVFAFASGAAPKAVEMALERVYAARVPALDTCDRDVARAGGAEAAR